ncbi:unnamed protein product [Heligmosomoides polygyrus]|uniref:BTB domain-containing protein n=1 Tax=Heligmosomoides polygyrus TaxID=6339 RepID=A0A3P7XVE8_HELPZ|nr:unnamed protein product [Heligmosomoides polygyrus]
MGSQNRTFRCIFEDCFTLSLFSIRLNVGGTIFETTLATLRKVENTVLSTIVSERWRGQAELFIDRDPTHFSKILNYLRDGDEFVVPMDRDACEELKREAQLSLNLNLSDLLHHFRDLIYNRTAFRTVLLHEFKLSRMEAVVNVNTAWGEDGALERTVFRWFSKFLNGRESIEDEAQAGRPSLVDHDTLKEVVEEDPRQPLRVIARYLGVPHTVAADHLKQLADWCHPTEVQQLRRMEVANSLIKRNFTEPFLHGLVMSYMTPDLHVRSST